MRGWLGLQNGNRFNITRDSVTITIQPGSVAIDVEDGFVFCDPQTPFGCVVFESRWGIGIFAWEPKRDMIGRGFQRNATRIRRILRHEEERTFEMMDNADPIIQKRLQGRAPTQEDFDFLHGTHGLHPDFVNDFVQAAPSPADDRAVGERIVEDGHAEQLKRKKG